MKAQEAADGIQLGGREGGKRGIILLAKRRRWRKLGYCGIQGVIHCAEKRD